MKKFQKRYLQSHFNEILYYHRQTRGVREIGIEYLPEVLLIVLLALLAGINIGRLIAGWESWEEERDNSDDQSGNSQD